MTNKNQTAYIVIDQTWDNEQYIQLTTTSKEAAARLCANMRPNDPIVEARWVIETTLDEHTNVRIS